MNILAFADLHGNATAIDQVMRAETKPDLVLLLGDISNFGKREEAEQSMKQLDAADVFVAFMAGVVAGLLLSLLLGIWLLPW